MRGFLNAAVAIILLAVVGLAGCASRAPSAPAPTGGSEPATGPRTNDVVDPRQPAERPAAEAPSPSSPPPPPVVVEAPSPPTPPPRPPREPASGDGPTRGVSIGSAAAGAGTGGGGLRRELAAVVVEITPTQRRAGANGGSAVVLLSSNGQDRARDLALCQAVFRALDAATAEEADTGERRRDGVVELLRPLYWLTKGEGPIAGGAEACPQRIAQYDFARAARIRAKLGLTGAGPYLAVIAADDRRAGVVDIGAAPTTQAPALVAYFRDGFSQEADIWRPERHTADAARLSLGRFRLDPSALAALPRLIVISAARAACPVGDLLDACDAPPRP